MTAPAPPTPSAQSSSTMSLESVFVQYYMQALQSLQNTWLYSEDESGIDSNRFNLQIEFLVRLIPDRSIQDKIRREQAEAIQEFTRLNVDHIEERSGLVIVTAIIEFLCSSFDLLHVDITGPGTSKQYREAVLEIPDMPPIETISPPPTPAPALTEPIHEAT